MTEREAFVTMLTRAGIPHDVSTDDGMTIVTLTVPRQQDGRPLSIKGYSGFSAEFLFSTGGDLRTAGIWE